MNASRHAALPRSVRFEDLRFRRVEKRRGRNRFGVELLGRRICTGTRAEIHRFLRTQHPYLLEPFEVFMRSRKTA